MGLNRNLEELEDSHKFSETEIDFDENLRGSAHKRQIRKVLEEKLERKRLKEELEDELDSEFDWDDYK